VKLRLRLRDLVGMLYHALHTLSIKHALDSDAIPLISVPKIKPESPIFSILTPHPRSLAKHCQDAKLVVRAVVPPTVPTKRVRVCLHSGNTPEQINRLVDVFDHWISLHKRTSNANAVFEVERARL
jgi:8-amino-7-oxononanoate synthase